MEAPEKLYLINDEGVVMLSYDPLAKMQSGDRYDFIDKAVFSIEEGCKVEYTRTDAFIEKACEWLEPIFKNYAGYNRGTDLLNDFRKAME